jgi:predicted transcriptional regulator YdeE
VHTEITELGLGEFEFTGHVTQVEAAVAAVVAEYVPTPQLVHDTLPLAILYVSVTQAEHGPPSGPVNPALHVHAEITEFGLGEFEFAGHVTQVDSAVAAVVAEYVPAPQLVHAALPLAIL